jgi:hypothetical protein
VAPLCAGIGAVSTALQVVAMEDVVAQHQRAGPAAEEVAHR